MLTPATTTDTQPSTPVVSSAGVPESQQLATPARAAGVGDRLIATCRQFTGIPWCHRGYVLDRATGKIVTGCPHRHRSRVNRGGKNGEFYAMRCAEKMLAAIRRERAGAAK